MANSAECLAACRRRLSELGSRLEAAVEAAPEGALDRGVPPSGLAPRQIARHMAMTNEPYLKRLTDLVGQLPPADAGSPVRRSRIGKFLERVAGPEGNAPIPSAWRPPDAKDCGDAFADLARQFAELDQLAAQFAARDLSRASLRNPMLKLARMTVEDAFLVLASHTERHVRQIEDGLAGK